MMFLLLLLSQVTLADLKISLVTMSPGDEIETTFGHTALLVEDTDKPGVVTYYGYGQTSFGSVISSPRGVFALQKLFDNQIVSKIENETKPIDAQLGVSESILNRYYFKLNVQPGVAREVRKTNRTATINELALTQEQANKLIELVTADIAAGTYFYRNFDYNCATRVRDRLFDDAVLGKEAREALQNEQIQKSFNELGMESMDEAVALSPNKNLALITRDSKASGRVKQSLAMAGLSATEYASSKEFYDAIIEMQTTLESYRGSPLLAYAKMDDAKLDSFLKSMASYFFAPEVTTAPITKYQSLFLPKNLRAALSDLKVLSGKEIRITPTAAGPIVDGDVSKPQAPVEVIAPAPATSETVVQ